RWDLNHVKEFLSGKREVEPHEVYVAVKTIFEELIEVEDVRVYDFLTLWSVGTYFFPVFFAYPYLFIHGAKRSGKTKLGDILAQICFNAQKSASITSASLFRTVEAFRCTLIMDEEEKLANLTRSQDLRSLLLAGYKKGSKAIRTNPNTLIPEEFHVWSPKVIINLSGLEDVLEDRCITLVMKRGKNPKIINADVPLDENLWSEIRDRLYLLFLSFHTDIKALIPETERLLAEKGGLKGRNLELWKPIMTLAFFFNKYENGLFDRVYEFAIEKAEEAQTHDASESLDAILVETLVDVVKEDGWFRVKDVTDAMARRFDEPQKWLTSKWTGNALRRLGFTQKRRTKTYEYYLSVDKVRELAERFGLPTELTELTEHTVLEKGGTLEKPSIGDLLKEFRQKYPDNFNNVEFYHFFVNTKGLSEKETAELLKSLTEHGEIFPTYEGVWRWA
ncbi:MAG: hypothetical protein QXH87_04010, partial [Candidatus Bathyarchaeia archaeon]